MIIRHRPGHESSGLIIDQGKRDRCQISAIVFDFDGVVLDTETPLYSSWKEMYARHGAHLDLEMFATYIGGAEYFDFHTHLEEQTGLTFDRKSLMEERRALYREHVSGSTVAARRERLSQRRERALGLPYWPRVQLRHRLGRLQPARSGAVRRTSTCSRPGTTWCASSRTPRYILPRSARLEDQTQTTPLR